MKPKTNSRLLFPVATNHQPEAQQPPKNFPHIMFLHYSRGNFKLLFLSQPRHYFCLTGVTLNQDLLSRISSAYKIAIDFKFAEFKIISMFGMPTRGQPFFDYCYQVVNPNNPDNTLTRHRYNLTAEELSEELDKFIIRPYSNLPPAEEEDLDL